MVSQLRFQVLNPEQFSRLVTGMSMSDLLSTLTVLSMCISFVSDELNIRSGLFDIESPME